MDIIREVNGIQLNKGNLMANGLFNVSNNTDVSFWFDTETKDELINASDEEFEVMSNQLISESCQN
jgi:hypothetical protein